MSVKIALNVVGLEGGAIPENVFIYFGTMVFGCLVAQDVIRLTHDAFKAEVPPSIASPRTKFTKRFFWLLRLVVNGLVFSVVYLRGSLKIMPFIGSLLGLCAFKYAQRALPITRRLIYCRPQIFNRLHVSMLFA